MNSAVPTHPSPHLAARCEALAVRRRAVALCNRIVGALWALYVLTLRQYSHGKRWMVVTALFLLPRVLAILIRATTSQLPPLAIEFLLVFMFIPQAILPLVALLYASSMIQDELEEQTITYLLIRPLPKLALYLVKLLATITATVALTVVFTIAHVWRHLSRRRFRACRTSPCVLPKPRRSTAWQSSPTAACSGS